MKFETWKKNRIEETNQLAAEMKKYPWRDKEFYAAWLTQTYYYVCHSTRLLAASASRFGVDQDELHQRFWAHMGEEKRHEALALKDLKTMGIAPENYGELPATSAFYQSQYFMIEHRNPSALLGYILMLEALAVQIGPPLYAEVSKHFGPKASVFVKVHAEEDPDHVDKAFKAIESMDEKTLKVIDTSFQQSLFLYRQILESCKAVATQQGKNSTKAA
jgi:pyrroloquinoline quinone (PQQ) biosynthesis protein C